MKSEARASLDDLAIRWETPRGREVKAEILQDLKHNKGERLPEILKDFIYVAEVPDGRDLRCITLEELDLSDMTFKGCDLSWASFARSTIVRGDFREANLKRANLAEANLSLARFAEADCARADFSRANLEHANFKDTKLSGAVFVNANCSRASFDTSNLTKCNFVGATLEQANFANADCNNGNFSGGGFDSAAAKPAKAWGIVYDMATDEFERKVGLNSLGSRTTKKFKGLDVLLKASAALAKVSKKTGQIPAADELALGAPPGMRRLETFKRIDEGAPGGGEMVFGASLRRGKGDEEKKPASDVASASDYIDEPSTFDPDDPQGNAYPEPPASEPVAEGTTEEAVGSLWTDGRPENAGESSSETPPLMPEAPPAPPVPTATPRPQPRPPTTSMPAVGAPRPTGQQPAVTPPATGRTRPPTTLIPISNPQAAGSVPPSGRVTKPLGPPPAPSPSGKFPLPGTTPGGLGSGAYPTNKLKPPAVPGAGPAPTTPPVGSPLPGGPKAPTRSMPKMPSPPAPVAPAAAPSFMAPLDAAAPDPTADWAKAIGQLMQSKSSITKIVIETGDKSRIVFKKP